MGDKNRKRIHADTLLIEAASLIIRGNASAALLPILKLLVHICEVLHGPGYEKIEFND